MGGFIECGLPDPELNCDLGSIRQIEEINGNTILPLIQTMCEKVPEDPTLRECWKYTKVMASCGGKKVLVMAVFPTPEQYAKMYEWLHQEKESKILFFAEQKNILNEMMFNAVEREKQDFHKSFRKMVVHAGPKK